MLDDGRKLLVSPITYHPRMSFFGFPGAGIADMSKICASVGFPIFVFSESISYWGTYDFPHYPATDFPAGDARWNTDYDRFLAVVDNADVNFFSINYGVLRLFANQTNLPIKPIGRYNYGSTSITFGEISNDDAVNPMTFDYMQRCYQHGEAYYDSAFIPSSTNIIARPALTGSHYHAVQSVPRPSRVRVIYEKSSIMDRTDITGIDAFQAWIEGIGVAYEELEMDITHLSPGAAEDAERGRWVSWYADFLEDEFKRQL